MKKTLDECIEQYKFYSCKYADAVTNHEGGATEYYFDKICALEFYAMNVYNVDLNEC